MPGVQLQACQASIERYLSRLQLDAEQTGTDASSGNTPLLKLVSTIEMHTAGEPFRIITSGLPHIPGTTIIERRTWLRQHADSLRTALMHEPRGHADMYGGYLVDPVTASADIGIIFIHNEGYSDHCGHGSIAVATAAVELGWVKLTQPETRVGIDAPCGFIEAFVQWDGQRAGEVRFVNVPSFLFQQDVAVTTPSFGVVKGDIAYGGAFYFYASGAAHGLHIREENGGVLQKFGSEVKAAANAAHSVQHPVIADINHIYGTIVDGKPRDAGSNQANCCIFANAQIDRSPTGSGTAGRVAQLYLKHQLSKDAVFVNESIIGSVLKARVLGETKVGRFDAVVPEVSGRAVITGFSNWILDPQDRFNNGFLSS